MVASKYLVEYFNCDFDFKIFPFLKMALSIRIDADVDIEKRIADNIAWSNGLSLLVRFIIIYKKAEIKQGPIIICILFILGSGYFARFFDGDFFSGFGSAVCDSNK